LTNSRFHGIIKKTGKEEIAVTKEERLALVEGYLGREAHVEIDRPIGYVHHKKTYSLTYPINYGYIPGVLGGDGEELDVYVMGVDEPLASFDGRIIGIVFRENDVEDKLIAAPVDRRYSAKEIAEAIHFQEQYYRTHVKAFYDEHEKK
jgi:inorganic pyrophosphatase